MLVFLLVIELCRTAFSRSLPSATGTFARSRGEQLNCWGDGSLFKYDLCCLCGNDYGNLSGQARCWSGGFTFDSCCRFYSDAPAELPNIPCWLNADGPKRLLEVPLQGRRWKFVQKLQAPYKNPNHELAPYVLWPSAYILAAWLHDLPVRSLADLRVVELGSGLALPSLVAAEAGASSVVATDVDRSAVALARRAGDRNLRGEARMRFEARRLDFQDARALAELGPIDLVLIAGQFYLEALNEPLARAVSHLCARQGCTVLMSNWVGMAHIRSQTFDFAASLGGQFDVKEIFDCGDRGYVHPHADYECVRLERRA
eukprot:TRINITY_DN71672_c0_g1_i1.p1 TRINITY_DN71672_c0_g1~~TRINITY_DN71672_c0_g1_i1.p1  ORF type:complete len:315 (-),score=51.52 TRINITY_DN71672_c0_g1_i1:219-1163(-)